MYMYHGFIKTPNIHKSGSRITLVLANKVISADAGINTVATQLRPSSFGGLETAS